MTRPSALWKLKQKRKSSQGTNLRNSEEQLRNGEWVASKESILLKNPHLFERRENFDSTIGKRRFKNPVDAFL
jgi:hypothetical protein